MFDLAVCEIVAELRVSKPYATRELEHAQAIEQLPAVAAALRAGQLDRNRVLVLLDVCAALGAEHREALVREKTNGASHKVVFFKTGDRRIVRAETPVLDAAGAVVGRVLSGTLSPILNEAIGSALVTTGSASQPLSVDIRGTRLNLQLVKPPFVPLKNS